MSEEWGPWTEHDGKGCPLADGVVVHLVEADGYELIGMIERTPNMPWEVETWDWEACEAFGHLDHRVIRYRVRKPRGLTILESLIADLPEEVDA